MSETQILRPSGQSTSNVRTATWRGASMTFRIIAENRPTRSGDTEGHLAYVLNLDNGESLRADLLCPPMRSVSEGLRLLRLALTVKAELPCIIRGLELVFTTELPTRDLLIEAAEVAAAALAELQHITLQTDQPTDREDESDIEDALASMF